MILQIVNNIDAQPSTLYSFLSTNGTAGGTIQPVKNTNSFQSNWAIQLGKTGEETAEILTVASVSGSALNTYGTARFPHSLDTPVYNTHYDSVIFLRSTTGTAGTATALATVAITPDSYYTEYNDASGASTYAYQSQYYNSVSGDLSGTTPFFVPGGPSFYAFQRLKSRLKDNLYSANFIKNDDVIGDWVNEWIEVMTNAALKVNKNYSSGTTAYAFGTAGLGTITEPLFKYASKIEVTFDGIRYTPSTEIPAYQFSDQDVFSSLSPRHYWEGDSIFGVLPNGSLGTARMTLGKIFTPLVYDTDEVPQYLKGYTTSCIEYLLYKAYSLDQKDEAGDAHYQKFVGYQNAFVSEITPRDFTGVKLIQMVSTLSGDEDSMDVNNYYIT